MDYSNKFIHNLLILLSSFVFMVLCRNIDDFENNNKVGESPECLQKLIPCQPYLLKPKMAPATCCLPLKEMVAKEANCLCSVITNPAILQSFNITEVDALNLAMACGANADVSLCKNATSPSSPPVLSPPNTHSPPNGSSSSTPSQKSEAAQQWSQFERSSAFIALFIASTFLAFSA